MTPPRTLLVTGATGKQGGALINALLSSQPTPPFNIAALTRNRTSNSAKALAARPRISLVEGNLDDPEPVFKQLGPVWGVFLVTLPMGNGQNADSEETQGKALVDAAVKNNVKHFVFSSVDRGGPELSDNESTNVPHFVSKYRIEKRLIEKATVSPQGMGYTILRPTAFFDNLTPDFMGKGFAAMWKGMGEKKLQFISTRDVGRYAAFAFEDSEKYHNQAVSIAGDELNFSEGEGIFRTVVGEDMPTTFVLVGRALRLGVKELGTMFTFFERVGMAADIAELRKHDADLQDFGRWLRESSPWAQK